MQTALASSCRTTTNRSVTAAAEHSLHIKPLFLFYRTGASSIFESLQTGSLHVSPMGLYIYAIVVESSTSASVANTSILRSTAVPAFVPVSPRRVQSFAAFSRPLPSPSTMKRWTNGTPKCYGGHSSVVRKLQGARGLKLFELPARELLQGALSVKRASSSPASVRRRLLARTLCACLATLWFPQD